MSIVECPTTSSVYTGLYYVRHTVYDIVPTHSVFIRGWRRTSPSSLPTDRLPCELSSYEGYSYTNTSLFYHVVSRP